MKSMASNVFSFQDLESRMLLCAAAPADPTAAALALAPAAVTAVAHPHFTHAFNVSGKYSLAPTGVDAGKKYVFKGSGKPAGFGTMQLTGWVQTPGNLANGKAFGYLVMTNSHGTLKISVTGPTEPAFGPMPTSLTYHITSGTGAYAHASGSGTFGDTLIVSTSRFVFRF